MLPVDKSYLHSLVILRQHFWYVSVNPHSPFIICSYSEKNWIFFRYPKEVNKFYAQGKRGTGWNFPLSLRVGMNVGNIVNGSADMSGGKCHKSKWLVMRNICSEYKIFVCGSKKKKKKWYLSKIKYSYNRNHCFIT